MDENAIMERIIGLYPDAVVKVHGKDCHFKLNVTSQAFEGLRPLQRQQPIMALFQDALMSGALHALSVQANTPDEVAEL